MAEGEGVGDIAISRVDRGVGFVVGDRHRRSQGVKGLNGLGGGVARVSICINCGASSDIDCDPSGGIIGWRYDECIDRAAHGRECALSPVFDVDLADIEAGYGF